MGTWGARWLDLGPRDYEPGMVLWGWAKFIDPDKLPPGRVVVRFDLSDRPRERFWMLVDRPESEVCVKSPGLDEDLVVTTDTVTLTDVHRGRVSFGAALAADQMRIDGSSDRALPLTPLPSPRGGVQRTGQGQQEHPAGHRGTPVATRSRARDGRRGHPSINSP